MPSLPRVRLTQELWRCWGQGIRSLTVPGEARRHRQHSHSLPQSSPGHHTEPPRGTLLMPIRNGIVHLEGRRRVDAPTEPSHQTTPGVLAPCLQLRSPGLFSVGLCLPSPYFPTPASSRTHSSRSCVPLRRHVGVSGVALVTPMSHSPPPAGLHLHSGCPYRERKACRSGWAVPQPLARTPLFPVLLLYHHREESPSHGDSIISPFPTPAGSSSSSTSHWLVCSLDPFREGRTSRH